MGNNTKKKVRSLPPLGKESKSKGKKKPEGLDVQIPDRQRLIGSPAPQSMRNKIRQQKTFKKSSSSSEFPTITLSACEDDSDDDSDDDGGLVQKDSFIDVGQVGGGLRSRTSSASNLSISSIGSLVDLHRSMSARSGLTPPPRFLSMKNDQGNQVVSELTQLGSEDAPDSLEKPEPERKPRSGRHLSRRRSSNLPSLTRSPSRASNSSSLASSLGHGTKLPTKYSPLDPIKSGGQGHRHKEHRRIGRRRRSRSSS